MEQNFFGEMTAEEVLEKLPPEYLDAARELRARRERERKLAQAFNRVLREVEASERELARERAQLHAGQRSHAPLGSCRREGGKRGASQGQWS